jgi:peptide/nickel transport system substrate-binding protein
MDDNSTAVENVKKDEPASSPPDETPNLDVEPVQDPVAPTEQSPIDTPPNADPATFTTSQTAPNKLVKKFSTNKILLFVLSAILIIALGLGTATYFYKNKLNKDVAAQRNAATYIDHITVAYNSEPAGFYPVAPPENITINYTAYYYEGLTSFNKDMEIQPQLALSWENPDTNTWRFRLRQDVTFHNGQKMTADDVVASLEMAIANENLSMAIPTVQSITKIDDYTVEITTSSPTPILANLLYQICILPKSLVESQDWSHPIGTGPYKLVTVDGVNYEHERFESYYGTKPKVKNVTLTTIVDDTARLDALKSGDLDVAIEYTPTPAGSKTNDGKLIKSVASQPIDVIFLFLDSARDKSPYIQGVTTNPFKDVRVRQAMALALNIPDMLTSGDFVSNSIQASQLVPSSIFGYNPNIKPTQQNIEQAKNLMKVAGYENGFTVSFDTAGQQTAFQQTLKENLAQININLEVRYNSPTEGGYYEKLMAGDISLICISWTSPSGDALEAYENVLGKDGMANFFKIDDLEINSLISQARSTSDLTKRKEYLQHLATVSDEKKYVIPLLSQVTTYDYRDGLVLTPRSDSMNLTAETYGAVPDSLKDYAYSDAFKKLLHL